MKPVFLKQQSRLTTKFVVQVVVGGNDRRVSGLVGTWGASIDYLP
jgi:hypothetical protein